MNVILTEGFLKNFKKDFRQYHFSISALVKELKKTNIIKLQKPYNKVKIKLNGVDVRGIVLVHINNIVLPLYLTLKKDKKYGENLLVENGIEKKLRLLLTKMDKDLNNGDFIEY